MNDSRQLALNALKLLDKTLQFTDWENGDGEEIGEQLRSTAAALEADIAQAVEPVAWANPIILLPDDDDEKEGWRAMVLSHRTADFRLPLYTTPPEPAVNAELLEALKQALPYMEAESVINGYGYHRPANPHNFHPDYELCSEDEIANYKAACAAYDAGNYRDDYGDGWLSPNLHVTKAPWGIGSYNNPIPEIEAQCERARAAIAKATS